MVKQLQLSYVAANITHTLKRLFPSLQHRFSNKDVLVDGLREKKTPAIEFLMERCQGSVRKITRYYGLPKDLASDVLTDGIILLIEKIHEGTYDPSQASPQTYLLGICKNILANHSRKKTDPMSQDLEEVEIPDNSVEEMMYINERIDVLKSLLIKLGAPCNNLITLKYLDGYSDKEIIENELTKYTSPESLRVSRQNCMKKLIRIAQSINAKTENEVQH